MKRLTLLYDSKNEEYPWVLKHPKVKANLARFKTRKDAVNWYLSFDWESYIWFQNNKGIFGGQLACIENEQGTKKYMMCIPKVSGFDGEEKYADICSEFKIHPALMTRHFYQDTIDEELKNLDYIQESDPQTYFPADLEMKKKGKSSYLDLVSIKADLEQKIEQLQSEKNIADETISKLKDELSKEKMNFEEINWQIEVLKNRNAASDSQQIDVSTTETQTEEPVVVTKVTEVKEEVQPAPAEEVKETTEAAEPAPAEETQPDYTEPAPEPVQEQIPTQSQLAYPAQQPQGATNYYSQYPYKTQEYYAPAVVQQNYPAVNTQQMGYMQPYASTSSMFAYTEQYVDPAVKREKIKNAFIIVILCIIMIASLVVIGYSIAALASIL